MKDKCQVTEMTYNVIASSLLKGRSSDQYFEMSKLLPWQAPQISRHSHRVSNTMKKSLQTAGQHDYMYWHAQECVHIAITLFADMDIPMRTRTFVIFEQIFQFQIPVTTNCYCSLLFLHLHIIVLQCDLYIVKSMYILNHNCTPKLKTATYAFRNQH